jgi:hypothetical protein
MNLNRRWIAAGSATILLWCGLELGVRRSSSITDDWHGWRQADTQAIARNFAFEEFNPLRPRIDWRGDGPGYVETEWQLYAALIGAWIAVAGESVWPGQLISLGAVALAAGIVFAALLRRLEGLAAYAGLMLMLSCQGVVVAGTSIQPDALAFLAYTIGFVAFAWWLETPTRARLVLWVTATAIAGLVKPTTLELGVTQAVLVILSNREALRRPALWIGWAVILIVVGGFLWYARSLFLDYGNTFGVLSGGDSKLPSLEGLLNWRTWYGLLRFFVIWGIGIPAPVAAAYLLWKRRVAPEHVALIAGALVLCVFALRYTSGTFGTHYHLPHVVLGAFLVASAVAAVPRWLDRRTMVAMIVVASALLYARAIRFVLTRPPEPETTVGRLLADVASPGTLVAVRVRAPRRDPDWDTINNFEDPRVFYLSRTRGWALANDEPGAGRLADLAAKGARFYAHVNQIVPDPELVAWLGRNTELVATSAQGSVYRIRVATPPVQPTPR